MAQALDRRPRQGRPPAAPRSSSSSRAKRTRAPPASASSASPRARRAGAVARDGARSSSGRSSRRSSRPRPRRAPATSRGALQVSVMAGIRSDAIAAATGSERVVRAMPNTPALIGQGIAGLFARPAVTDDDRADAVALLAPTGELIWVGEEVQLDAVTALSGSGPAYVFLLLEALLEAGAADGPARAMRAPARRADRRRRGGARRRLARFARRAAPDRHLARRHDRGGDGRARDARRARRLRRRRARGARQGRGARQARRRAARSTLLPPPP